MKTSLSVTQQEYPFPPNATLLSATDTARPISLFQHPVIACRAGELGRGLAVIDSAVRSLVGRTGEATAVVSI